MRRLAAIALATAICLTCVARRQKSTRERLHAKPATEAAAAPADTIRQVQGMLTFSGFEKAQSATTESFFITNNTDTAVTAVNVTITYYNIRGEQLHRRTLTVPCELPSYSTVNVSVKSWDRQKLWYYRLTQARHNSHATPFDVTVTVNYVVAQMRSSTRDTRSSIPAL